MADFPDDLVYIIVSYLDLSTNLKIARYINTQFYDACTREQFWKHLSLEGFKTKAINGLIRSHGHMFHYLNVSKLRFGRQSTRLLSTLKQLLVLDLKYVYSNSLLDDRFCYLISKSKLKVLLLGRSTITDVGLSTLKRLQLKELELRHNNLITKRGIKEMKTWKGLQTLTFVSVVGVYFIHQLAKLQLKQLTISFCHNLDIHSVDAFCNIPNKQMTRFLLYGVPLKHNMIKALAHNCPNIEIFALCHPSCGQPEYNSLRYMKKINILSVICCRTIFNLKFLRDINLRVFFICRTKLHTHGSPYGFKDFVKDLKNCRLKPISAIPYT